MRNIQSEDQYCTLPAGEHHEFYTFVTNVTLNCKEYKFEFRGTIFLNVKDL